MRNDLMTTASRGYVPYVPTGFAQKYHGPVFEAEGGAGDPPEPPAKKDPPVTPPSNQPTDQEAKLLREVMAKKTALEAANAEVASLKAQFEGIDPVKVKELLAAQKTAEDEKLKAAGDFEALKKRMADEHAGELAKERSKTTEVSTTVTSLQNQIRELTVGSQFLSSKFLADDTVLPADIARVAFDSHFEVENGRVVGYDAPRGATVRTPLVNGSGDPLPFDEAMKRIVDKSPNKDKVLRSKATGGAGTRTDNNGGEGGGNEGNKQPQTNVNDPLSMITAGLKNLSGKKK